ncbi:MAG: translocation/assembly module TamB [Gemmatimonadaceae bacterium]|nr:translocation/assembly module TamB [Gemmatimonadaceae bacterium]
MSARQRRYWWAAGIIGALIAGVSIALLWVTGTLNGRRWVLARLVTTIDGAFGGRGHLRVGVLRDISWSGHVRADSVSIVDSAGVPVIHVAHVDGVLSLGALLDRRVHLRALQLEDLRVDLRRDFTGPWNFAYIISGPKSNKPAGPPGFGDDIRIDTLRVSIGTITTIGPWAPNAMFAGATRDSVIAVRDSLHDIIRTPRGLLERRRFAIERLVAHSGIIMQPSHAPSSLMIDSLRGTVSDPPVRISAAAGQVSWTPDSLRLALPQLSLPASHGSAVGRVWWHEPGAVRYDVNITAQAGLSDLTWIWDVLPAVGGGSATVRMRTLESADDAEYALSDLDVASMNSRISGRLNVIVRPADILMHHVDLTFAPIGSDLLRRLSYDAVPAAVNGSVTGRLVATTGGPLRNFLIDRLDAQFTDAVVPGAVSSLRASGAVTMGVAPAARNVMVQAFRADVRSARALAPTLPNIDGIVEGRGRIVAADLRAADVKSLDMTWTDGAGNVSRVTGDARVGYGLRVPTIELALILDPLSMRALARVDTTLGVQSTLAGKVFASGTLDSLAWRATLSADSTSRVALIGTASIQPATWRVSATGDVLAFDTHAWTARADMPQTALTGAVRVSAAGRRDSAALQVDEAHSDVSLRQLEAVNRPAFDVLTSMTLDRQRLRVDSLTVHVGGVTLEAHGALARMTSEPINAASATASLAPSAPDTLEVSARADTLESVRRQLTRLAATLAPLDSVTAASLRAFAADTLQGDASVSGYLFGSLHDLDATLALGARDVQIGAIRVGRIFGSLHAEHVLTRPTFEGVATADAMDGVGAIRIASTEFRVQRANPDSGRLVLDASSANDAHFVVRGGYLRRDGALTIVADSLLFAYDSVTWRSAAPIRIVSDDAGLRIDSLEVRSSARGLLALRADVPMQGAVQGTMHLERFPVGEAAAFALGTRTFSGLLTGDAHLRGSRALPLYDWRIDADSLGVDGSYLPRVVSEGLYTGRRVVAQATITDSAGGRINAEARVPMDLSIATVEKRLLSDAVDADIQADSLRLDALKISVAGVSRVRGVLDGHVALTGTMDRPIGTGTMILSDFSARVDELGIEPNEGRAVVRAAQDSLILESFRMVSGRTSDTVGVRGAMRYALNEPVTISAQIAASNLVLARRRDGTEMVVSGALDARGPLSRPSVGGTVFVPRATLMIDPLSASTALDLTSVTARQYLAPSEVPVVDFAGRSLTRLGRFASVDHVRVDLGNEVWVRTPEATVKLSGGVNLSTKGDALVPEGEITANRGQYQLALGVVNRSFSIDSGRVRFFGDTAIAPSLDISATNVVRLATGDEIPVGVHIGGTIVTPLLTLSSSDPLYASAPESEIISLLIFGAPTFALDGQSQSTVRAVTGVLLPSFGGAVVEGALHKLFPVFNTLQVTTAGGQSSDVNAYSLLDNLSITAGKQLGERTFLRLNTGVCRGTGQTSVRGASLWYGIGVEYRLSRGFMAQMGVDPGSAPCSRLGNDLFPRMQFGFDLFREWIF